MGNKIKRILGEQLPPELRMFNLVTLSGIVAATMAALATLFATWDASVVIAVIICDLMLSVIFYLTNKFQRPDKGSFFACAIVNLLVFPIIYFKGGGSEGGMSVWFILGILFSFLLLKGVTFFFMLAIQLMEYFGCLFVSYYWPEWIHYYADPAVQYIDIAQSVLIVSFLIGIILKFHNVLYKKASRRADEESEAKNNFLANISHEIRTPMNDIIGTLSLLSDTQLDPKQREYLTILEYSSNHLWQVVNDILDFSKIEYGEVDILGEEYHIGWLLHELEERYAKAAKEKRLLFSVLADENMPEALYGDVSRLRQILINLLDNAIKYTVSGAVVAQFHFKRISEEKGVLSVLIKDTGIGMDKEEIDQLFSNFGQMDTTRKRNEEGTGLGLAICQKLLQKMEGEITVESQKGKGSSFAFYLPQQIVDGKPFHKVCDKKEQRNREIHFTAPGARILVVDDHEINRKVTAGLLKRYQMQVVTATGGQEAIEAVEREQFDLIFMDHMMPKMDGIEATRRIRILEKEQDCFTPIMALTANTMEGVEKQFQAAGMNDYLPKPIDVKELDRILKKWIKKV